jgi:hypothetical protein
LIAISKLGHVGFPADEDGLWALVPGEAAHAAGTAREAPGCHLGREP